MGGETAAEDPPITARFIENGADPSDERQQKSDGSTWSLDWQPVVPAQPPTLKIGEVQSADVSALESANRATQFELDSQFQDRQYNDVSAADGSEPQSTVDTESQLSD